MAKHLPLKDVSTDRLESIIAFRQARALALRNEANKVESKAARAEQAVNRARKEMKLRIRAAEMAVQA